MSKTKLATILSITCSALAGCSTIPRPDTDLCSVNAGAEYQRCYNLKRDYTNEGVRKPDAQPVFKPAHTIADLDKNFCTDPQGMANLLIYIQELRKAFDAQ